MSSTGKRGGRQDAVVPGGPPLPETVTDAEVVGLLAVVTIRVPGGRRPGEIRLFVRGTYENLIAYALEPLDVGRTVSVAASRGGRAVDVDPTINGL
jgi:hypothetical protein